MTTGRLLSHCFALGLLAALAACGGGSPAQPSTPTNCSFTVGNEAVITVGAAAGEFTVSIATASGCNWAATSSATFITPMSPTTGSGNGSARFSVQANTGGGRLGQVRVADRTLDVVQASGIPQVCNYTVSPTDISVSSNGGDVPVTVANDNGCVWSATSHDGFITVKSGATGSGNGSVVLTVAAGTAARSGTATIAGQTVTISQAAVVAPPAPGCAFSVSPLQASISGIGGGGTITVTQTQGTSCAWTAQSQSPFITVVLGASGTGNGTVTVSVASNPGAARIGTVAVAGQTVTVSQQASSSLTCAFTVSPTQVDNFSDTGGSVVVTVTQNQGPPTCSWTSSAQSSFLSIASGAAGIGSGSATIAVAANSGAARSGFATVAGQSINIKQTAWSGGPGAQAAVLSLQSDIGDSAGNGQSSSFTLTGLQFQASYDPGTGAMQFSMPFQSGGPFWNVEMAAPFGQQLTPGLYTRAVRSPFRGNNNGLQVSGGGGSGCNQLTGRFLVSQAVYGPGNTIQRFHARFEQHCEGMSVALRGQIWIDAAGSTSPPPLAPFPSSGGPNTFLTLQTDPGFPNPAFSGTYSLTNAKFSGWGALDGSGVSLLARSPTGGGFIWSFHLWPPTGTPLALGTYANAAKSASASAPGMNIAGSGPTFVSCGALTGKFVVLELVYGPQGELERFRATFEQKCTGEAGGIRGEIFIVADPWR